MNNSNFHPGGLCSTGILGTYENLRLGWARHITFRPSQENECGSKRSSGSLMGKRSPSPGVGGFLWIEMAYLASGTKETIRTWEG